MGRLEKYLDHLYKNVNISDKEKSELKEEMRLHLDDYVQEAQKKGISKEDAITEAIEHFGDQDIQEELNEVYKKPKKYFFLKIAILFFTSSILFFTITLFINHISKNQTDGWIMGLENIFEQYPNQSNLNQIKTEVQNGITNNIIKDAVIMGVSNGTEEIIYRTIDNEGFPQDNTLFIETVENNKIININQKYTVTYSYNVINEEFILTLTLFLFTLYWLFFYIWFKHNHRGLKWNSLIFFTNIFGFIVFYFTKKNSKVSY